jgi:hypothetical protein
LPIAACPLPIADCGLVATADCGFDCGLRIDGGPAAFQLSAAKRAVAEQSTIHNLQWASRNLQSAIGNLIANPQ